MAAKPPRPYKDFLAPFLHRQFGSVMLFTLLLCYGEAILMGQWNSLVWIWFRAVVRAFLLFIAYLFVLCLCMSHAHTGARTTASGLQTFWQYLFKFDTIYTILCYGSSAWFYTVVYIWSQSGERNLGMVDQGKPYERSKLNERPIYIYVMFLQLSLVQSAVHLYRDYGKIQLPLTKPRFVAGANPPPQPSRRLMLKQHLLPMVHDTLTRMIFFIVGSNVTYFVFLRRWAWSLGYPIAKVRDGSIPNAKPRAGWNPFELTGIVFFEGVMLIFLWEFTNTALTIYLAKEPIKKDKELKIKPITNDSKDPNGSLLVGLKAKKDMLKNMSFWELAIISQRFDERRKTIYSELDRAGGETSKQILQACLTEITAVKTRIDALTVPPPPIEDAILKQKLELQKSRMPLIAEPLREDDVFAPAGRRTNRYERNLERIEEFAKRHGQTPGADPLAPMRRETYKLTESAHQTAQSKVSALMVWFTTFMRKVPWLGAPFQQTFVRRVAVVVLGGPYAHTAAIINAVTAVSQLAGWSLTEDSYGIVNRDVVAVIRTLADVIKSLEKFVAEYDVHWTDVTFKEESRKMQNLGDVGEVHRALKEGLRTVLDCFGEYLKGMDMSEKEIREASELVPNVDDRAKGPEMQQT